MNTTILTAIIILLLTTCCWLLGPAIDQNLQALDANPHGVDRAAIIKHMNGG
jgi:hypothetical protein